MPQGGILTVATRKISPFGRNDNAELERLDDEVLARLVKERANQPTIPVSVEDLSGPEDAGEGKGVEAREMRGEYRVGADPVGGGRPEAVTSQAETGADLLARILEYRDSIAGQRLRARRTKAETDTPAYDALPRLPDDWVWARLDEIADIKGGITKDNKRNTDNCELLPYLRVANVQRGYLDLSEIKEIPVPKEDAESLLLKPGDVLFNEGGDRDKLGRGWVWNGQIQRCVFQNHVFRARFHLPGSIEPKFISWYANTFGQDYFMAKGKQTTNLASINKTMLSAFPVPIAPLDQQKRIVAEIEKQFSRLDEAVANLKRVKANLKRYKAAVLKAAVEGRLVETEAELARQEGRGFETGEQLLQRILETRRSQWKGKGKYKEPTAPDTTNLPELSEGWVWVSLDQLTNKITSGSRDWSQYYGRGTGIFVLAQNVRPFTPDFSVQQFVDPPSSDPSCDRSRIQDGDLLATIVGANAGQICLVGTAPSDAYVCQSVALIRPVLLGMGAHLNYWLNSAENGQRYLDQCMYGQGRPHLSFEQLIAAPIALPSLAEQHRIVAEVDRRLSLLRETEAQVDANLQRAERLRQSILSRAFSQTLQ